MGSLTRKITAAWVELGPRYMPFADVVTPDLSLGRLLRLSLFQASVGMTLVLLVGTLNRVMIVEMGVSAFLVGAMVAMPLIAAPFRALIGFRSDTHECALGWRRVPFIWKGTLLQFGGFSIMPFAIMVLAGMGESSSVWPWVGPAAAGLAFLLAGAGAHMTQTAGLALATDLTPSESHPRVVGLMYIVLLLAMVVSALVYGVLLSDFSPGRLVAVVQGTALVTMILNGVAMWRQETRRPIRGRELRQQDPSFRDAWAEFCRGDRTRRRLLVVGLGTLAFGMAEILLEPFGGEVLQLSVSETTRLTAFLALGGLMGFGIASYAVGRGTDPYLTANLGVITGIPGFIAVMIAAPMAITSLFTLGNYLIGLGGAMFAHGTLTATMNRAPKNQAGMAIGAWGAVQATAAGIGIAAGAAILDIARVALQGVTIPGLPSDTAGQSYFVVYATEISLLVITLLATIPLMASRSRTGRAAAPQADAPLA